jgi:hypothetical protein
MMVVMRSRRLSITRADMMPGMAQAKLDRRGMKERPCRPVPPMNRSIRKAARAMYPKSSRRIMNRNRIMICGRYETTLPTP